jgi:hypothetical protein
MQAIDNISGLGSPIKMKARSGADGGSLLRLCRANLRSRAVSCHACHPLNLQPFTSANRIVVIRYRMTMAGQSHIAISDESQPGIRIRIDSSGSRGGDEDPC